MKSIIFAFILAFVSANLSAQIDLKSVKKMKLTDAETILNNQIPPDFKGKAVITELTTDELWAKMHIQLYSVYASAVRYFVIDNEVVTSVGGLYDPDLNFVVTDLDGDSRYELISTWQFGSGISVGQISFYMSEAKTAISPEFNNLEYGTVFSYDIVKKSDREATLTLNTPSGIKSYGSLGVRTEKDAVYLTFTPIKGLPCDDSDQ